MNYIPHLKLDDNNIVLHLYLPPMSTLIAFFHCPSPRLFVTSKSILELSLLTVLGHVGEKFSSMSLLYYCTSTTSSSQSNSAMVSDLIIQ